MSKPISEEAVLQLLPSVLARDKGMEMLAEVTAKDIPLVLALADKANVFGRIDELDEELLDLLAKSLKVDWYQYDKPISVKRNQIKSNWYIHRKLGTLSAVNRGLTDVWPPSYIEEWFEYGGDPYKFRVILDASGTYGEIRLDDAMEAIRFYKPVRAHMDGPPVMKVSFGIIVGTAADNALYHVKAAGTEPRWATHGSKGKSLVDVHTDPESHLYSVPATGQAISGTYPRVSTHGNKGESGAVVLSDTEGSKYTARPCGTSLNALM